MYADSCFLFPAPRASAFEILIFSKFQKNGGNAMSRRRTKAEEIRNPEHYFNRYIACERKKEQEEDAEYYDLHESLDSMVERASTGYDRSAYRLFSVNLENEEIEDQTVCRQEINVLFDALQTMNFDLQKRDLPTEPSVPEKCRYAFSKVSDAVWGEENPCLIPLSSIKEVLAGVVQLESCRSIQELYVVIISGFYALQIDTNIQNDCER